MLLENAVKHNELSDERPLEITVFIEDGTRLVVKNNVQPKEIREASSGIGLENIRARYTYLTEEQVIVTNDGQHFTVKLPLLRSKHPLPLRAVPATSSTSA